MKIPLVEPFNAITSWEDYEYQGHVALYYTLKKICLLLQSCNSISAYDLQIEGEEDFSIRKDEKYISLHQVKAGAIKLGSNDKFAFVIGAIQSEAEGYFHISNGKSFPSDFVLKSLDHINILKNELKKSVIEKKDIPTTGNADDYIVLENISGNHQKANIYSILKYVSGNSKDKSKIQSTISEVKNALDTYEATIKKKTEILKKDNSLLCEDEAFLHVYEDKFDNAKEIRLKAYDVIIEILRMECPDYSFIDTDYAALVYDQLLLHMKEKVTEFYIEKNKNQKCILTFNEILEQITTDYHAEIDTVAYQYFQVLRSIRDAFAEYPDQTWNKCVESNCKDCKDSNVCNLYRQINILNDKSELEKNQIIHNLILKTPQVGKSNNLPQDSLVSHLFLNLLDEIKTLGIGRNNVYEVIKDVDRTYRLTLDSSYDINEFQKNLRKELEKEADRSLLYECDVLITDRLSEETLIFNGGDVNVLTGRELSEISEITSSTIEKMKKDCNRPKIISLINKNKALGELK